MQVFAWAVLARLDGLAILWWPGDLGWAQQAQLG
jgi:hypothetical protein